MIQSFRDKDTERLQNGMCPPKWKAFQKQAEKRLRILDAAKDLRELGMLNSNHLETLRGNRKGQYSIRINEQWRICFEWSTGKPGPESVEIIDYH